MLCNILEILRYRNPDVETFKCKCGVLQHASCFDSRPALYISLKHLTSSVLCQPPPNTPPQKKKKTQLNSTGLYNTASCSSICTRRVYVRPSLFFLEIPFQGGSGNGKGEALVSKHAQAPAYLRCLAGIIIAAHCKHTHTHTETLISLHMLNKSRGTPASLSNKMRQHWGALHRGASVRTCHWRTG